MTKSILLVGVGGQGTILAGKLLTTGLLESGYDVKMSEIHGMSQRGGSVSTQVRYGEKVESPVIEPSGADILVSFEQMEALRWLSYVKPGGKVITNDAKIASMPILSGDALYPDHAIEEMQKHAEVKVVGAQKIAEELGNPRVTNVVLLGSLIKSMDLEHIDWEQIIRDNVKENFIDINLQALKKGLEIA